MADPSLAALGVTAHRVAQVEDAVFADAEAKAANAAQDDFEAAVGSVDDQITALHVEERALRATPSSKPAPAKLAAIRRRISSAQARRQALVDAHEERARLAQEGGDGRRVVDSSAASAILADDERVEGESERDFLIRTGRVTPFQGRAGYERQASEALPTRQRAPRSTNLGDISAREDEPDALLRASSRKRGACGTRAGPFGCEEKGVGNADEAAGRASSTRKRAARDASLASDGDYSPSGSDSESEDDLDYGSQGEKKRGSASRQLAKKRRKASGSVGLGESVGDCGAADSKKDEYPAEELEAREGDDVVVEEQEEVEFDGGLRVPGSVYDRLFDYQKTGVCT